jgi:transposase-like protein
MPAERTIMRQVREVLRLKFVGGVPIRVIARRIGVAASTVRATIKRFQAAGLNWPLPEETTDAALEARLFANAGAKQSYRRQIEPDWESNTAPHPYVGLSLRSRRFGGRRVFHGRNGLGLPKVV